MTSQPHYQKGIILAGGSGTRLSPLTLVTSKQLLPVYDKPLIYYPLSVLMLAGIREILLISTPEHVDSFRCLLGTGQSIGLSINYAVQPSPEGLAQAFLIGRDFIGNDPVAMVLGDNLFDGDDFPSILRRVGSRVGGASVFACPVSNPEQYGVVTFNALDEVVSIQEKPKQPRSNFAVPGLYFYDSQVVEIAEQLKPSSRGELEVTDIHAEYLRRGLLHVESLSPQIKWLDVGTPAALLQASQYVHQVVTEQHRQIACLEEIAYKSGFIDDLQLQRLAMRFSNEYGKYLLSLLNQ